MVFPLVPFDKNATQIGMGFILFTIYLSGIFIKRFHWSVGLAFLYFSTSNILRFMFPPFFFGGFKIEDVIGFEALVLHAQMYLLFFLFIFTFLNRRRLSEIEDFLILLAIIDGAVLTVRCLMDKDPYFFLNNAALDCMFIATVAPLGIHNLKKYRGAIWLGLLFLVPLVLTQTSTGLLGLGLLIGLNIILNKRYILAIGSLALIALAGFLLQGAPTLLNGSGRYEVWKMTMKFWGDHMSHWFGYGLGTFKMLGPAIQIANLPEITDGMIIPGFFWMHNDWLQVLFEGGWIGLGLAVLVYLCALRRLRGTHYYPSLFIFGMLAIIQMPTKHFLLSLTGALLVAYAFTPSDEEQPHYE